MVQIRNSLIAVSCIIFLQTGVSGLFAAPMLLKQFDHSASGPELGNPLPPTIPFDFDVYNPNLSTSYVEWLQNYGPSDVGKTFLAPVEVVQGANQAIASLGTKYLLETGPANFSSEFSFNLSGHIVTSVERTINQLIITPIDNSFYGLQAAQTIQIWGVPIPEASTIALFGIGLAFFTALTTRLRSFSDA
jgi:hypothetical protein